MKEPFVQTISHSRRPRILAAVPLLLGGALVATSVAPTDASAVPPRTWWVATSGTSDGTASSCADPDAVGTTHAAIQAVLDAASDGETVRICAGTYAIGTTVVVDEDVTITGDGVTATVLDGGSTTRIMEIASTVSDSTGVTIRGIQFHNGYVSDSGNSGGAINAHRNARLTVTESLFRDNEAADEHGGAIAMNGDLSEQNNGSLHISGTTFIGNGAGADGGAVSAVGMATVASTIANSTFVQNWAGRDGGGVNATFGNMQISHSTFLDNRAVQFGAATYKARVTTSLLASSSPSDTPLCYATRDHDVNADPDAELSANVATDISCLPTGGTATTFSSLGLTFLAPWGGPTPTVSISTGSAAIDAVTSGCDPSDQRGVSRGSSCDAGAFEFVAGSASLTPNRITMDFGGGQPLEDVAAPTVSGLTSPTFRVASEVGRSLPDGVSLTTDGRLTGTPDATIEGGFVIITGSDTNGATTSMRIDVACRLQQGSDGFYEIASAADLAAMGGACTGVGEDYRLTDDIVWSGVWSPIASSGESFTGTLDGDGHSITGLEMSGGDYTAFISLADGATITDLTIEATVVGGYSSAVLVGYSDGTHIENVRASGTVTGVSGGAGCTGGLAGEFYSDGTITDSSFTGDVDDPDGAWVGGLVGCAGPAIVSGAAVTGSVTGDVEVGGLVGWMEDTLVVDSFAVGDVTGAEKVGGLVGYQGAGGPGSATTAVSSSYAAVTIDGGAGITGGLIGSGESTAVETSFWEAGLTGADGLAAFGEVHDGGTPPTWAVTPAADLHSFSFLDTAGWAVVDGWADPATSTDVWGVCDLVDRAFHLWAHPTDPCVAAPDPTPEPDPTPQPDPTPELTPTPSPAQSGTAGTDTGTTTTSAPTSTTTTTTTTTSETAVGPVLRPGEVGVLVDGRSVDAGVRWTDDGSVVITVGEARLVLGLGDGGVGRHRLAPKARIRLDLSGLRGSSPVAATMHSTPTALGGLTTDTSGSVSGDLAVPESVLAGEHRLNLEAIDRAGRTIDVWLGVAVEASDVRLPATGGSDMPWSGVVLVLTGVGLSTLTRRRAPTA
jgi:hypothetical protein